MSKEKKVDAPQCVTIFGAGVTGLSAAHELVERGFRVQVWEPQGNDRFPERGCDIGGLARTQWTRAHWPEWADLLREPLPRVGRFREDLWLDAQGSAYQKNTYGSEPEDIVKELIQRAHFDSGDIKTGKVPVHMYAYYRAFEIGRQPVPGAVISDFKRLLNHEKLTALGHVEASSDGSTVVFARNGNSPIQFHFESRDEKEHRRPIVKGYGGRVELYYLPSWGLETQPIVHLPQRFLFKNGAKLEDISGLGATGEKDPHLVLRELHDTLKANPAIEQVYIEISNRQWQKGAAYAYNKDFLQAIRGYFTDKDFPLGKIGDVYSGATADRYDIAVSLAGRVFDATVVRLDEVPEDTPEDVEVSITNRVRERWFPGEHGYRFFPHFYRHLYDTLDRIPILDIVPKSPIGAAQERSVNVNAEPVKYVETDRTVHQNIVPRPATALAFKNAKEPTVIGRYLATSLDELSERMGALLKSPDEGGFGFTEADAARYFLRSFEYVTTCTARREEYEEISWHDYLRADTFSASAREALSRFPKALVAMDGKESDARTIGSVGAQTGLDQLNPKDAQDGALNGPTSEAWFGHWRRYLEAQGVEFIHGELVGLVNAKSPDGKELVWPVVNCFEPRLVRIDEKGNISQPDLMPGYFVLALPVQQAHQIALTAVTENGVHHPDLECLAKFDLEHELFKFVGIQFYFWEDLYWIDGHVYFPDSPWALTSISQTRKWADRPDWEHGYRGVLSVIIGQWEAPGDFVKRKASECTPDEIAKEIWFQIRSALERDQPLPRPLYYHIDDNLTPPPPDAIAARRAGDESALREGWKFVYEYQIQTPRRWKKRPGDLGDKGYSVEHGVVLAGTYMKHYTRITSMEAANESARHAVNAILSDCRRDLRTTPCEIWPIEDNEPRDLKALKQLDAKLYARGLPHYIEILGLDELTRALLERSERRGFDSRDFVRYMTELADFRSFLPFGRDLRSRRFP